MVFQYYQQVLAHATAFIDIRSGSQWSYHWYSSVYSAGKTAEATALAAALGLPQVMLGQPEDQSMAREAALDGKLVVVAHTGGGPGLRDHRERDQERIRNAVLNAMRHLKMLHDAPVYETDTIPVIEAHTVLLAEGERGMVFVDASRRGSHIQAGEAIGYIRHPFTGEVLENITAPRAGVMLHAGTSWPMPLEGLPLAILGDVKQEIKVR
jgi:predicted deacylase